MFLLFLFSHELNIKYMYIYIRVLSLYKLADILFVICANRIFMHNYYSNIKEKYMSISFFLTVLTPSAPYKI